MNLKTQNIIVATNELQDQIQEELKIKKEKGITEGSQIILAAFTSASGEKPFDD